MARRGVTLIELLIVITILAILAGAAIPYVAGYLDEARVGRTKTDLEEIKQALARFELTRGTDYATSSIASLVGPFMSKMLIDPWGAAYVVSTATSEVYSKGPDGAQGGGDDLGMEYRPPMAMTKVEFLDIDNSGTVSANDAIHLYFTRPGNGGPSPSYGTDFTITGGTINLANAGWMGASRRIASYVIQTVTVPFTCGSDTLSLTPANTLTDFGNVRARQDTLKIINRQ